jgi:hypothetical protein
VQEGAFAWRLKPPTQGAQTRSPVEVPATATRVPAAQVRHGVQLVPSPKKPLRQTHEKAPGVFVQAASALQPAVPERHSSTSSQVVTYPPAVV